MTHRFGFRRALFAFLAVGLGGVLRADPVFITDPGQNGTQSNYVLGMDFTVGSTAVTVTSLGVFDALGDGIAGSIQVGIFDLAGNLIGSSVTFNGSGDSLIGGSRFRAVTPFSLAANTTYSIVAGGFTSDLSGNSGQGGVTSFNGQGLLTLVDKGGRWSNPGDNSFQLPTANTGLFPGYSQSDPVFLAGTFSVPDGGITLALLGFALSAIGFLSRRVRQS
jgi:hypothetical protein